MPVNVRSPKQWEVISSVIDFDFKTVLDVGCGHGDLLMFAKEAGADITGVDNNIEVVRSARARKLPIAHMDICQFLDKYGAYHHWDIAFCFSVLPYVDIDAVLSKLSRVADVVIIEAQLFGDGPGTFYTEGDLLEELLRYWHSVRRIGETKVEIRDTIRAIWMCEGRKEMEMGKGVVA